MKRRRLLCAALFLLVAAARLAADDGSFSVCWWNIENFGVADRFIGGQHVDAAMKPPSEINAVVAILKRMHPDILGVAELVQAPGDANLKLLQSLLKQAGLDYPYTATVHGEDQRIQTGLLSRFPIRDEEPFTDDSFPVTLISPSTGERMSSRFRVGRGFLNARVDVAPGVTIQVMVAHLKSKRAEPGVAGEEPGEGGDETVRFHEAEALRRHVEAFVREHPGSDLLVMGDCNDVPNSKSLRPLMGSRENHSPVRDLPLTDRFGDWWTHFYIPAKSYERIDYIFASPAFYHRFLPKESYLYRQNDGDGPEFDPGNASDHRPLFTRFAAPFR